MAQITEREQLIFDIASAEWDFFQLVNNTGGRASCQGDPDTFFKMRMSQWMAYSDEVLKSYWADLEQAAAQNRNPVFEKYGYMMETTFPEEYTEIQHALPAVSEEKMTKIEEIVKIHLEWDAWMFAHYPNIRQNGRVMTAKEDGMYTGSSMESYLRGELKTCSEQTVALILKETLAAYERQDNLLKQIVANETAFYGYASLEDAEKAHGKAE